MVVKAKLKICSIKLSLIINKLTKLKQLFPNWITNLKICSKNLVLHWIFKIKVKSYQAYKNLILMTINVHKSNNLWTNKKIFSLVNLICKINNWEQSKIFRISAHKITSLSLRIVNKTPLLNLLIWIINLNKNKSNLLYLIRVIIIKIKIYDWTFKTYLHKILSINNLEIVQYLLIINNKIFSKFCLSNKKILIIKICLINC